jgi:catechol 2,3-dioxygenase-like lactoylglutathione lyase family enzyme
MDANHVVPILNVSDVEASFDWFAKLGWRKHFEWCSQPDGPIVFGAVMSGECEIFMCLDDQGGRDEHGAWMSIWVDDADAIHERCVGAGIDVIRVPADEPWGVRELHVLHPDGHVFRISQALEEES